MSPVNDMSKDHVGPLSSPMHEEEVVMKTREEAKLRVQQLHKLSSQSLPLPGELCVSVSLMSVVVSTPLWHLGVS